MNYITGVTLIPWRADKPSRLGCDSGLHLLRFLCGSFGSREAGAAAELAATRKMLSIPTYWTSTPSTCIHNPSHLRH